MTRIMLENVMLINITDLYRFFHRFFSIVLVSFEKIYQTLTAVFDEISNHLKFQQKYSAMHRTSHFLFGVWKCVQTRTFVLDMY